MLLSYRRFRRNYLRPILWVLFFVFSIDAIRLLRHRPNTYRTDPSEVHEIYKDGAPTNTTIFIASVHRNTEEILRTAWGEAVLGLVDYFGPQNVYFSAIESGSQDESKAALLDLQTLLDLKGVANTISLGQTVWEQLDEINTRPPPEVRVPTWVWNVAESQWEMRRIPYLARVRNQAMEPLRELEDKGITFDKVLWINDVVFDVRHLIHAGNTRLTGGS